MIISGPCSAETEEQVLATALSPGRKQVKWTFYALVSGNPVPARFFRRHRYKGFTHGCRKPVEITGLPLAVEVATAKQVEDALHFGVDILWVGARTTVNPFSVQEVADALRGVDTTVLIKNPINPDLELWIGAVERIQKAGINKVGLIHRGFSSYGNTQYRNAPMWHLRY